jgi:hypothetical protein
LRFYSRQGTLPPSAANSAIFASSCLSFSTTIYLSLLGAIFSTVRLNGPGTFAKLLMITSKSQLLKRQPFVASKTKNGQTDKIRQIGTDTMPDAKKKVLTYSLSYRLNLQALMTLMAFSSSSLRFRFIFLSLASLMRAIPSLPRISTFSQ